MNGKAVAQVAALLVLGGAGAGIGYAVYDAGKDQIVNKKIEQYNSKLSEVETIKAGLRKENEAELAKQVTQISERLQAKFAKSTNDLLSPYISMSNNFNATLTSLTNSHQKEIATLNDAHQKNLFEITNSFGSTISNLNAQIFQTTNAFNAKEKVLEQRRLELEQKFFAPLTNLTIVPQDNSKLTPLEQILFQTSFIGNDLYKEVSQDKNIIYGQAVNSNMTIKAYLDEKKTQATPQPHERNPNPQPITSVEAKLIITRSNPEKTNTYSAHLYSASRRPERSYGLSVMRPSKEIFFNSGNEVVTVNHDESSVVKFNGEKIVYQTNDREVLERYMTNAQNKLNEFIQLHQRGPQAPEVKESTK